MVYGLSVLSWRDREKGKHCLLPLPDFSTKHSCQIWEVSPRQTGGGTFLPGLPCSCLSWGKLQSGKKLQKICVLLPCQLGESTQPPLPPFCHLGTEWALPGKGHRGDSGQEGRSKVLSCSVQVTEPTWGQEPGLTKSPGTAGQVPGGEAGAGSSLEGS